MRRQPTTPSPTSPAPSRALIPPAPGPHSGTVTLQYVGIPSIVVHGQATGRHYAFSAAQPLQQVDAGDAATMLRTRYFRARAG